MTRPILVVIDGAKALRSAVETVFDTPIVARCQLHKIRNVQAKLPERLAATVGTKMRAAYKMTDPLEAEATLAELARQLDRSHPGAAGSLREGLAETLTVMRLGVPPDPGPHAALDQRHRVHDRDMPRPLQQRQELAGRDHGPALVRGGDGRGRQTVPSGQRTPPPPRPPPSPRRRSRPPSTRGCHTPQLRSDPDISSALVSGLWKTRKVLL